MGVGGISPGPGGRVLAVDPTVPILAREQRPAPGDRVRAVGQTRVYTLAQLGAALRSLELEPDQRAPITMERYQHTFTVRLNYPRFEEQGFPPEVQPGDRLLRYADKDVSPDETMDEDSVRAILARYAGESVDFTFGRPIYRFKVGLPLVDAPLPFLLVLLFLMGIGVAGAVVWWRRARPDRPEDPEQPWWLLSAASAAAPWGMFVLLAPNIALWDPLRLIPGLVALSLWRPLSFLLHRRLRGALSGGMWATALAPGALLALASLMAVLAALAEGSPEDPTIGEQAVIQAIRAAAALLAAFQVIDLAWWLYERRVRPGQLRWPLVGVGISSLALIPAAVALLRDADTFLQGGFLSYAAAMMLILWVGDMSLFVDAGLRRAGREATRKPQAAPSARAEEATGLFFAHIRDRLAPDAPVLVVTSGRQSRCIQPVWGDDDKMPELSFFDAGEIWRAAVGLLRDERMALPMVLADEEENPTSAEVVRGISDKLGWTTAFCLLDEVHAMQDPSHEVRERALFAFLVVERGLCEINMDEREHLGALFRPSWPHLRGRFLDSLHQHSPALARAEQAPPKATQEAPEAPAPLEPPQDPPQASPPAPSPEPAPAPQAPTAPRAEPEVAQAAPVSAPTAQEPALPEAPPKLPQVPESDSPKAPERAAQQTSAPEASKEPPAPQNPAVAREPVAREPVAREPAVVREEPPRASQQEPALAVEESAAPRLLTGIALEDPEAALDLWLASQEDLQEALSQVQVQVYREALRRTDGNKSAAARLLGIKRSNFVRRLKEEEEESGQG